MIAIINHRGKRGFVFLGSETQKMINCEDVHVIIQCLEPFTIFPIKFQQTIPNKRNQNCRNYLDNQFLNYY